MTEPTNLAPAAEDSSDPEDLDKAKAAMTIGPLLRHASVASAFGSQHFSDGGQPSIVAGITYMREVADKTADGDMRRASNLLTVQALTLDTLFTEMARRSGANMGEHLDAAERYMRLALKAQANCRQTLEALAKLHQPREQTVRHIHVNEGGQAIVADNFHHHGGIPTNASSAEQSHEQSARRAALSGPDASGHTLPTACHEGQEAVPAAWGAEQGRAEG